VSVILHPGGVSEVTGKVITIDVSDAYAAGLVNSSQIAEVIAENRKDDLVMWYSTGCNGFGYRAGPLMTPWKWLEEHGFELEKDRDTGVVVDIVGAPEGYTIVKVWDECQEEVLVLRD